MLDYEEELKKFKPSLEVDDIEEAVYQEDLSDMTGYSAGDAQSGEIAERYGGIAWSIRRKYYISQITGIMMD